MKKRKKESIARVSKEVNFLRNLIFFLNVFLALIIIGASSLLIQTSFGMATLFFGFLMLCLSTLLKIVQMW